MSAPSPGPALLNLARVQEGLTTRFVGQEIVHLPVVGSTIDVARDLAAQGTPEGTLVFAEEQTAGRGRRGRSWLAPAMSSLLCSVVLYPDLAGQRAARLTMVTGLASAQAVEERTGLAARLKWPNDVLAGSRKIGGVLVETAVEGEEIKHAILSLGLNVNFDPTTVRGIPQTATSLRGELGREVAREPLLQTWLERLEESYLRLDHESLHGDWSARLATLGQEVSVDTPAGRVSGMAERVDADGTLIVRREDGTVVGVSVGEVS